jgi:phosphodiesterase/alkaline phosphatase D-like protein
MVWESKPGNLAAINSLKIFRTLRFGRNVELILTDNRSYRSEPVMQRQEAGGLPITKSSLRLL